MVAESAGGKSFKIGLLVFEILHNQYFGIQYLLQFQSYLNVMFVTNGKTFSDHVPEKIFLIRQAVQKLWPYFNLHVSITQ